MPEKSNVSKTAISTKQDLKQQNVEGVKHFQVPITERCFKNCINFPEISVLMDNYKKEITKPPPKYNKKRIVSKSFVQSVPEKKYLNKQLTVRNSTQPKSKKNHILDSNSFTSTTSNECSNKNTPEHYDYQNNKHVVNLKKEIAQYKIPPIEVSFSNQNVERTSNAPQIVFKLQDSRTMFQGVSMLKKIKKDVKEYSNNIQRIKDELNKIKQQHDIDKLTHVSNLKSEISDFRKSSQIDSLVKQPLYKGDYNMSNDITVSFMTTKKLQSSESDESESLSKSSNKDLEKEEIANVDGEQESVDNSEEPDEQKNQVTEISDSESSKSQQVDDSVFPPPLEQVELNSPTKSEGQTQAETTSENKEEKTSVGTSTFSDNTSSSEIAVTNFEEEEIKEPPIEQAEATQVASDLSVPKIPNVPSDPNVPNSQPAAVENVGTEETEKLQEEIKNADQLLSQLDNFRESIEEIFLPRPTTRRSDINPREENMCCDKFQNKPFEHTDASIETDDSVKKLKTIEELSYDSNSSIADVNMAPRHFYVTRSIQTDENKMAGKTCKSVQEMLNKVEGPTPMSLKTEFQLGESVETRSTSLFENAPNKKKKMMTQLLPPINVPGRPFTLTQTLDLTITPEGMSVNYVRDDKNVKYIEAECRKETESFNKSFNSIYMDMKDHPPSRDFSEFGKKTFSIVSEKPDDASSNARPSCGCIIRRNPFDSCRCEVMGDEILNMSNIKPTKIKTCECNVGQNVQEGFRKQDVIINMNKLSNRVKKMSREDFLTSKSVYALSTEQRYKTDSIVNLFKSYQLIASAATHTPEPLNNESAIKLVQIDDKIYKTFVDPKGYVVVPKSNQETKSLNIKLEITDDSKKLQDRKESVPKGFYSCQASQCNLIIDQCLYKTKRSSRVSEENLETKKIVPEQLNGQRTASITPTEMSKEIAEVNQTEEKISNITIDEIEIKGDILNRRKSIDSSKFQAQTEEEVPDTELYLKEETESIKSKSSITLEDIVFSKRQSVKIEENVKFREPIYDEKEVSVQEPDAVTSSSSRRSSVTDNLRELLNETQSTDQYIQDKIDKKISSMQDTLHPNDSVEFEEITISISYTTDESISEPEQKVHVKPEIKLDITLIEDALTLDQMNAKLKKGKVEPKKDISKKGKKKKELEPIEKKDQKYGVIDLKTGESRMTTDKSFIIKDDEPTKSMEKVESTFDSRVSYIDETRDEDKARGYTSCFKCYSRKSSSEEDEVEETGAEDVALKKPEKLHKETEHLIDIENSELPRIFQKALEDSKDERDVQHSGTTDMSKQKVETFTKVLTEPHLTTSNSIGKTLSGVIESLKMSASGTEFDYNTLVVTEPRSGKTGKNRTSMNYMVLVGDQNFDNTPKEYQETKNKQKSKEKIQPDKENKLLNQKSVGEGDALVMTKNKKEEKHLNKNVINPQVEVAKSNQLKHKTIDAKVGMSSSDYSSSLDLDETIMTRKSKDTMRHDGNDYMALINNNYYDINVNNRTYEQPNISGKSKKNPYEHLLRRNEPRENDIFEKTNRKRKHKNPKLQPLYISNQQLLSSTSESHSRQHFSKNLKYKSPNMENIKEGEKVCNCSISSGEFHICSSTSPFRKKHRDQLKQSEVNVQNHKAFYNNWISYYIKDK